MPQMPDHANVKEGILKGMYLFKPAESAPSNQHAQLFGSGAIMNEVLRAQQTLAEDYDVAADVWSITSYKSLRRDGIETERWNMLHPSAPPRIPYISQCLAKAPGVFVAASDYLKALPDSIARWFPKAPVSLGTDGFGRSDGRRALRDFFEVDARHIVFATLSALHRDGAIDAKLVHRAMQELEINPDKISPLTV